MTDANTTVAWVRARLAAVCEEVPVQGDRPLLLDDPSCAYVTLSGHHHLFCVGYQGGQAGGRREHMAPCPPGQVLFGLEPTSGDGAVALLLSGISGSVVWRLPTASLYRLATDAEGRAMVSFLFDSWIALLGATLPPATVPARARPIRSGETVETDGVTPIRCADGVVWIAPARRPRNYFGLDLGRQSLPEGMSWPLGPRLWALCEHDRFAASTSAALLETTGDSAFAQDFCRFVVTVIAARRAHLAATRLRRDSRSQATEKRTVSHALVQLATVGAGERLVADVKGTSDLERACGIVAAWLGAEPPRLEPPVTPTLSSMRASLARASGIRSRPVILPPGWERRDNGALLGFLSSGGGTAGTGGPSPPSTSVEHHRADVLSALGGLRPTDVLRPSQFRSSLPPDTTAADPPNDRLHPVALLPDPGGGYLLQAAGAEAPRRVDEAAADQLSPHAFQIYAPLPARPLTPLGLLRFSSFRAGGDVVFVALIALFTGALGLVLPLLTGEIFDDIIPAAQRTFLLQILGGLVAVVVGQTLFDVARGFALVRAQTRIDTRLEAGVWDRVLSLPLPFFRRYSSGELGARVAGIAGIREIVAGATLTALLSAISSLWNFGLLFIVDMRLGLAAAALVALAALMAGLAAWATLGRQRRVAELDGRISGLLQELLGGIAKLRVSGAENRAFALWARLFARRRDAELGAETVNLRLAAFHSAFPLACTAVLFGLVIGMDGPRLPTGRFLAFSSAFGASLAAVLTGTEAALHLLSVVPIYDRARPILTEPIEGAVQGASAGHFELQGAIEVSHVSFRYEENGPLVLDDVSLRIRPGELVAIVGPSGSGKSTLLRVLLGFDEATEGGVFYDGQALVGLDRRALRQQIGVVLQNGRVMPGDILTNIVGTTGLDLEAAWRAVRQAGLEGDIQAMPMGMHTVLSAGGGTLSGGQKQRLLIARALASQPRVVFLDEATSALDNTTQAIVSASLEQLRVTRVVIAHRLSTIRGADKIVVLERGRVVQVGSFAELMGQDGTFRQLARRQMV